jgi:predicted PurR-regulated permease PerM
MWSRACTAKRRQGADDVSEKIEKDGDDAQPLESAPAAARTPFSRIGLVALVVLVAVVVWLAIRLVLLVFAGVLFAIFLRTAAGVVSRYTRLPIGWSLLVAMLLMVGLTTGAGFFFAPRLAEQAQELTQAVPQAYSQLMDRLRETTWGEWIVEEVGGGQGIQEEGQIVERAADAATRVFDAIVALVIVLFVGIYLAIDPLGYASGLLRLVPRQRRQRIGEVLFATGYQLRWWLLGQLISMLVVGLMMGIGLGLIGVPLALALGVLAGLLEFIPTLGPPLAVIPAVLLAVVDEPQKALYVLILYAIVQTVEGYLLTPLVQQRVVHLKPVVTITTQVFFAWTIGAIGLLVAVPLIAAIQIAVQMLYVQDFLGDTYTLRAAEEGKREFEEANLLDEP